MTDERKEGQSSNSFTVNADGTSPYHVNLAQPEPRGGPTRADAEKWIQEAKDAIKRNLTEHQKEVEEAAGMSLDWGLANGYQVGAAQSSPEPRGSEALTEQQVRDACESAGYPNFPGWCFVLTAKLNAALAAATAERTPPDKGNISDGYHTFNELYEHRHALFSVAVAAHNGWKSKLHSDGTMFDGWFIAGVLTPKGQATYHLPLDWWDRYKCAELERAPEWDGHTAAQVPERIAALADRQPAPPQPEEAP